MDDVSGLHIGCIGSCYNTSAKPVITHSIIFHGADMKKIFMYFIKFDIRTAVFFLRKRCRR